MPGRAGAHQIGTGPSGTGEAVRRYGLERVCDRPAEISPRVVAAESKAGMRRFVCSMGDCTVVMSVLDLAGVFVFALSGALQGVRKRLDVVGMVVLAFFT